MAPELAAPRERCLDNLLEYLYGLLDAEETRALESHLPQCAACQTELDQARQDQALLSRAAHVVREIAPFALPGSHTLPETAAPTPAAATTAAAGSPAPSSLPASTEAKPAQTLPFTPKRRSKLRRYWPAWAAAAGILAAVFGLQHLYARGLERRTREVTRTRKQIEVFNANFASLKKTFDQAKEAEAGRGQEHMHLHVLGPTQFHPAIPVQFRIEARDVDGALAKTEVRVEVLRAADGEPLHFEKAVADKGKATFQIPSDTLQKLDGPSWLIVEARAGKASEKIKQKLLPVPTTYATHLALNKNSFSTNEVLFFRTLTLDRVSHQPPKETVTLRYALVDSDGNSVLEMGGQTNAAGISACNFALGTDLPGGAYTLTVRQEGKGKESLLPQAQVVELVRAGPEVEFKGVELLEQEKVEVTVNRDKFKPGDEVQAYFRSMGSNGKASTKKTTDLTESYELRFLVDGRLVPLPASQGGAYGPELTQRLNLDALGNAIVKVKLPEKIENDAVLVLEKKVGDSVERLFRWIPLETSETARSIAPVAPSGLAVDFFPEGGELVAGVENKIYFRVHSATGAAVDPENLVIRSGGVTLHRAGADFLPGVSAGPISSWHEPGKAGLGYFYCVPKGTEKIDSQITWSPSPGKKVVRESFQNLNAVIDGVTLHVSRPVAEGGTPIDVFLRAPVKTKRRLLLLSSCRGVVFDQQLLDGGKGESRASIVIPPGVDGVLRLTLLEIEGADIKKGRPLGERLVYRAPREQLVLTCTSGKGPHSPGNPYKLDISVQDEKKKNLDSWVTAVVVDDRVSSPYSEANLASFFHIATSVSRPEDLDRALIHLNQFNGKIQDSATALDLYLSIYGWRRFSTEIPEPSLVSGVQAAAAVTGNAPHNCLDGLGWSAALGDERADPVPLARAVAGVAFDAANHFLEGGNREDALPVFSRESGSLTELQLTLRAERQREWNDREETAQKERADLLEERDRALLAGKAAKEGLDLYKVKPEIYFWASLGWVLALLLAGAVLGLLYGVYRYARAVSPRPGLAFSLICMALAFLLYLGGKRYQPDYIEAKGGPAPYLVGLPWEEFRGPLPKHLFALTRRTETPPVWTALSNPVAVESAPPIWIDRDQVDRVVMVPVAKSFAVTTLKDKDAKSPQEQLNRAEGKLNLLSALDSPRFEVVDLESLFQNEETQERFRIAQKTQRRMNDKNYFSSGTGKEKSKDEKKEGDKNEALTEGVAVLPPPPFSTGLGEGADALPREKAADDKGGKSDKGDKAGKEATAGEDLNYLVREYAYRAFPLRPRYQPTVFWSPALFAENGRAQVTFDLSPDVPVYRVLLFANSPSGRLGFYEDRIKITGK